MYYPNYCFTFWYHMLGEGVGVVAVVIKQEIYWVMKNETGSDWQQAQVTLDSSVTKKPGQTVIQLIAIRGMNFKSDMAIDDISLTRGKCEVEAQPTTTTTTTTRAPITTTARPKIRAQPKMGMKQPAKMGAKLGFGYGKAKAKSKFGKKVGYGYGRPTNRAAGKAFGKGR